MPSTSLFNVSPFLFFKLLIKLIIMLLSTSVIGYLVSFLIISRIVIGYIHELVVVWLSW